MPKSFHKHRLLLDENLPHRTKFPRLNGRFDVKHVRDDFKQAGLPDAGVYQLAVSQQRILATYNVKDFRPLVGTKDDVGMIGMSTSLSASQIDTKLSSLLTRSTPNDLHGKMTMLTGES